MKTMKMILAGVLLMLPLLCQAQKNLFNKLGFVSIIALDM